MKERVEIALQISVCQRENNYLQLLIVNSSIYSTGFENKWKLLHDSKGAYDPNNQQQLNALLGLGNSKVKHCIVEVVSFTVLFLGYRAMTLAIEIGFSWCLDP